MKNIRWCLLLVLSFALSLSIVPGAASAASDYDNLLRTSPILYVHTDGSTKSQKMDISDSWWPEFKQVYAKRILQGYAWPSNFATEFEDIVQNGGRWGVATYEDSTGALIEIYGTHDPDAYCGFVGSASTGQYQCTSNYGYGFVRASFFVHSSYANLGCTPVNSINSCSETGMNIYAAPEVISGTAGYTFLQMPTWALEDYPFFFMNFDLNYPVGYEGELIPQEAPNPKYVAMGDSFSSGEGNPPFEFGTDRDSENECHRSPKAWPRLMQFDLELGSTAFVACSGATTDDVTNGQWNEDAQTDALSEDTEVVTITIGGNDVGFKAFAEKCVSPLNPPFEDVCDEYTEIYDDVTGEIAGSLSAKLEGVYAELLNEAPNAEIYVVGYPIIAPYKIISDPFDEDCGGLYDAWPNTWGDARAAYEVTSLLNNSIEDAVSTVNTQESSARLHYVDSTSGAFEGHDICSSDSYFNGINAPPNMPYSLHPNNDGHIALKEDVSDYLN